MYVQQFSKVVEVVTLSRRAENGVSPADTWANLLVLGFSMAEGIEIGLAMTREASATASGDDACRQPCRARDSEIGTY